MRSDTYSLKGTMYYKNQILGTQLNIKTYLKTVQNSDQSYLVNKGTYTFAGLVAGAVIGLVVSPGVAGAIIGSIFGTASSIVLTSLFEVRCDLTHYTWKGVSSPSTAYPEALEYGTIAKVLSNGKTYKEGYTSSSDWKNNKTLQRQMYYKVYGIEVYPDSCK